jgi:hypothetical protein
VTAPSPSLAATAPSRTATLLFQANQTFEFLQSDTSAKGRQRGVKGDRCYTTSRQFATQVLARNPDRFTLIEQNARLNCLAREQWAAADYAGRRVLFVLPSAALGNNVATLLFLHAFAEQRRPKTVAVFGAGSAADIYFATDLARVYPLWLSQRELAGYDCVIDLGQLESRRDIEIWPVDMEADLLAAFNLAPASRFPGAARRFAPQGPPLGRAKIGVFPLASSPLRTLPAAATLAVLEALAPRGDVTLSLNRNQRQGRLYAEAVANRLPAGVKVVDGCDTVAELLASVAAFDFAVFADSGPAHMAKLFAVPGVAVYSSAPGDVLQGRFTNLARWTIPFKGPHCASPCGLAKLRQSDDGRIGCMGSLGVSLAELPKLPKGGDAAVVEKLFRAPVPCLAALAADPKPLAEFVVEQLSVISRQ